MGTFQHFTDTAGQFRFRLRADNNEIILTSEGYTTKANAKNGVAAVRAEAPNDARYERKQSVAGFTFNLRSVNGQVIGTSEVYSSAQAREVGIESVKRNAPLAVEVG